MRAFEAGEDIHLRDGFDGPPKDVTAEQRRYIKAVNFGLIYGMSCPARSSSIETAAQFIDKLPALSGGAEMQRTREYAREHGYVGDGVRPPPVAHRHWRAVVHDAPPPSVLPSMPNAGNGGRSREAGDDRGRLPDHEKLRTKPCCRFTTSCA